MPTIMWILDDLHKNIEAFIEQYDNRSRLQFSSLQTARQVRAGSCFHSNFRRPYHEFFTWRRQSSWVLLCGAFLEDRMKS
jgi:hypothetical protein